jgi:hypothetical protein
VRKSIDLGVHDQDGWPYPKELEHHFLLPSTTEFDRTTILGHDSMAYNIVH